MEMGEAFGEQFIVGQQEVVLRYFDRGVYSSIRIWEESPVR